MAAAILEKCPKNETRMYTLYKELDMGHNSSPNFELSYSNTHEQVKLCINSNTHEQVELRINSNMKPARPWMLAHLKIIWQFHAHPVHQKVSRFFGPRYIWDDLLLGPNLVSLNRAVVPLLELSFLTKSQKLTSA
jgi:hypothetical protein